MSITQAHLSSVCEIKTLENELIATGILENITDEYIEVVPKSGSLPLTEFGKQVKLNIYNSKAGFRALVGTVFTSSLKFIRIVDVETLTEHERRNFFRVDTSIRAQLAWGPEEDRRETEVRIHNISLNGALFTSPEELGVGLGMQLKLRLLHRTCCFDGMIQRCIPMPDGTYRYGCLLQEGSRSDQDTLCAFIFMRQRQQISRQRGGGSEE